MSTDYLTLTKASSNPMSANTQHGFSARIIADSVSPNGKRLTTAEMIFPRMILSELNTHRMLSKNSASSRAIPVVKQLRRIYEYGYIPSVIGVNQAGMQARTFLEGGQLELATELMHRKKSRALIGALEDLVGPTYVQTTFEDDYARILTNGFDQEKDTRAFDSILQYYKMSTDRVREDHLYHLPPEFLNIHKQTTNRYLEPFMFHTVVISGTDWENMFALRINEEAQPEIHEAVRLLKNAMDASTPRELDYGQWHMPFIQPDEELEALSDPEKWKWISAGRCARASYETHDGRRDTQKDESLSSGLLSDGHMSPFEHPATPSEKDEYVGNFDGWTQLRKTLPFESNYQSKLDDSGK